MGRERKGNISHSYDVVRSRLLIPSESPVSSFPLRVLRAMSPLPLRVAALSCYAVPGF
jgi:hypothetical protein